MTLTTEHLARIRTLLHATNLPLQGDRHDGSVKYCLLDADEKQLVIGNNYNDPQYGFTDAEFPELVILSINAMPALIEEREGQYAAITALQLRLEAMTDRAETAEAKLAIAVGSIVDACSMPAASLTGHIKPRRSDPMSPARFPIMVSYAKGAAVADPPLWIPWRIAELAYAAYSSRFGTDQTLQRLAERGGFGAGEMDTLLPGWREMPGVEL